MSRGKIMNQKKGKVMDEIQRTAIKGSNRTRGKKVIKSAQLNVRITPGVMEKLRSLSKASGRSQAWIVEHAILQSLEFNS